MTQDTPTRFFDTRQAAAYLALSPSTLEKRRVVGDGPRYRKFGRSVRYTRDDLDVWADSNPRRSTSDPGGAPADAGADHG